MLIVQKPCELVKILTHFRIITLDVQHNITHFLMYDYQLRHQFLPFNLMRFQKLIKLTLMQ